MKKQRIHIPLIIASLIFAIYSCDKVEPPYSNIPDPEEGDTIRKVLLEEFTGHTCIYCPDAHETGENLQTYYGSQLIAISIHAGYFAEDTTSYPGFDYNFTTQAGDELATFFSPAYPSGLTNRVPKPGITNPIVLPGDWGGQMSRLIVSMPLEPDAYIHLDVSYDSTSNSVDIDSETTFFTPNSSQEEYKLVIVITEDRIIKPQKHHANNIMDYEHNHVLRKAVNGTWGEVIHNGAVSNGDAFTKDYSNIGLGSDWVPENCNVVAYIYYSGGSSDLQIIQAQEIELK